MCMHHLISTLFPYTTLFRSDGRNLGTTPRLRKLLHDAGCQKIQSTAHVLDYSAGAEAYESTDRKSTRLNSSHGSISYAVFCLKKKICGLYPQHGSRCSCFVS